LLILTLIFRLNILASMLGQPTALRALKRTALAGLFLGLGLGGGCGGRLPAPTAADATRARQTWSDVTVTELELGRHVYATRCSACHALYEPARFPASRWPSLVRAMSDRARLWASDGEAVTRYLVIMADGFGRGGPAGAPGQPARGASHAE
jgi:mono/diheme cytochrome c family protein